LAEGVRGASPLAVFQLLILQPLPYYAKQLASCRTLPASERGSGAVEPEVALLESVLFAESGLNRVQKGVRFVAISAAT